MRLGELLTEDLITFDIAASNKWEAIDALLDLLVRSGKVKAEQRKVLSDALVARENIASPGLEHGVAIPHASVDVLDEAVAVFAIARGGIPFQANDGMPAKLVILLLIPRKSIQKHIRTLTCIARLLNFEEMRNALLNAPTPADVLRIIKEEEEKSPA